MNSPIIRLGPAKPQTPLLISIPHAGRHYPPALAVQSRLTRDQLESLEDRFADSLATAAAANGHMVLVAQTARAWIDLNRAEEELDPEMVEKTEKSSSSYRLSPKVRGGLGLIPRRIAKGGDLWRGLLSNADIESRVQTIFRPYHAAIAETLGTISASFGTAILLDLHSMPPVRARPGEASAHVVVGDLYGRSTSPRLAQSVLSEVRAAGFRGAHNRPYAGGYVLEKHAQPH